jgi:hypothetical protein
MKAFLTGSHVYGEPREDSDIDIVIPMEKGDLTRLVQILDNMDGDWDEMDVGYPKTTFRVGPFNLIFVDGGGHMKVWKEGTEKLKKRKQRTDKPVTRKAAIRLFDKLRQKWIFNKETD